MEPQSLWMGWVLDQFLQKWNFARNYIECPDLYKKSCFQPPPDGGKMKEKHLLGIA